MKKKIKKAKTEKKEVKKVKKKEVKKKEVRKEEVKKEKVKKYTEAVGRRKTAVARVRIFTEGEKNFSINGKKLEEYFPTSELQQIAKDSLEKLKSLDKFGVLIRIKGGGLRAQAEAVRHGTARALVLSNPTFREELKGLGYLTRDPRMKERKKFGLKGARRAPQWSKR